MLGRPILTQAQLRAHGVGVGGVNDVIWAPLYDFNSYVGTTGHTQLSFFVAPKGQGTTSAPGASGAKTIFDTNMTAAGQLTKGNEFYMTGLEVLFYPGIDPGRAAVLEADAGEFLDDVWVISKSGVLTLTVGTDRKYVQDGPLGQFPSVTRIACAPAITGTGTTTGTFAEINYAVLSGEPYSITPLLIEANQGFQVTMDWPAAVVLPSAQNARIGCRLRGYLIRQAT